MQNLKLDTDSKFKKPNTALVMMPKIGNLTSVSRKLFNVILHTTQKQVIEMTKNGAVVDAKHYFTARLDELVKPIQASESNIITHAKNALKEMRRVEVSWEAPDANSGVIWSSMNLLSEARIVKEKGILFAYWALPPGLMEVIEDPIRFTLLEIDQISMLKTYAAVALYEICTRYKNNPSGLTSEHNLDWWVDALTQTPRIDPKTNKARLRPWTKFKNEHGNAALREINEKSDIGVELVERKGIGKTIVAAQFKVWRKSDISKPDVPQLGKSLAEKVTILGLELSSISTLLRQGQNEIILMDALTKLEMRITRDDQEPVGSRLAYLRKILESNNQYIRESTTHPVLPKKIAEKTTPELKIEHTYRDERRLAIRLELLQLSKTEQKKYAIQSIDELKSRGQSNPAMSRKIESEEWVTYHILFNMMIEKFAIEQYGIDWAVEP